MPDTEAPRPYVILDTETTSLDHLAGEVWEFAGRRLQRDQHDPRLSREDDLHLWCAVDVYEADPDSLAVGGFHERHPWGDRSEAGPHAPVIAQEVAAHRIAAFLDRAVLIGCVPSFDERFLLRMLYRAGVDPTWHYRPVDVETLAEGWLLGRTRPAGPSRALPLPWKSLDLSRAIGVDPEDFDRHTAMGDVLWAEAMLDALTDSDWTILAPVAQDQPDAPVHTIGGVR